LIDKDRIKHAIKEILYAIGEDPNRDGLLETPERVANMYEEIFQGLHEDIANIVRIFPEEGNEEVVIVKDIPFYSMCEHHLVPFVGVAHVAYIPSGDKIIGLSKLARIVDMVAKKPQLQERISNEVADIIQETLTPRGIAIILKAEHLCMTMRGIKKPGSKTVTAAYRGSLKADPILRREVLDLINT
jgi:GTP cyclohydrolase I